MSKFLPREFGPYARFFNGPKPPVAATGYIKPDNTGKEEFEEAWFWHQKVNDHHWQYWITTKGDGSANVRPMPRKPRLEMVADWIGAGLAQHKPDTKAWYEANKDKMVLHPDTRQLLELDLYGSQAPEEC
jgi:hypothetical protein